MSASKYIGGCHCKRVQYEVKTDLKNNLVCDCSRCSQLGAIFNFVDKDKFKLLKGEDELIDYRFNKKVIRHLFCKHCGIESFAEGVTFPKVAINVRSLEGVDLASVSTTAFSGKDL